MTFKQSDIKTAIGLLINGALRAREMTDGNEGDELVRIVNAIVSECFDWCESLPLDDYDAAFGPAIRQDWYELLKA